MRKNYPITDNEIKLRPDQYLISKTDLKGRITYANPAFVEISGFTRNELMGKAHNIVRHPHMPPAAFQDLWDTLHAGKPWTGIVNLYLIKPKRLIRLRLSYSRPIKNQPKSHFLTKRVN